MNTFDSPKTKRKAGNHTTFPKFLTSGEVADILRCSEQQIAKLIHEGALRHVVVGTGRAHLRVVRIPEEALNEFIAARTNIKIKAA